MPGSLRVKQQLVVMSGLTEIQHRNDVLLIRNVLVIPINFSNPFINVLSPWPAPTLCDEAEEDEEKD